MAKAKRADDDEVVSASTLARRLGITQTSVSRLAGDGVLVRAERGRYQAWASVRGYLDHFRKASSGKSSPASIARAKLLDVQARRTQFLYETERNEWVRVDAIGPVVVERFRLMRDGVLAAKDRIGGVLPHLNREDLAAIDDVLRETVHELRKTRVQPSAGVVDLVEP
jgi:hypothetical protein